MASVRAMCLPPGLLAYYKCIAQFKLHKWTALYHLSGHLQVKNVLDEILEKLPEEYNLQEIMQKTTKRTPYILVCFQECERMNILMKEIRRSLKELDLGLKVSFRNLL